VVGATGAVLDVEYFEQEIAPRLGAGVEYLGHLGHPELRDLVAGSRVAVVSSVWDEPFGLVAAEAMAVGTPVAAFGAGALADLVDASSGRLAERGDVAGLAGAMRAAAELDRGAVRRSARRFDLDAMGRAYERRYGAVMAARARRDGAATEAGAGAGTGAAWPLRAA
jgi:glycosyltransferase involved in cell wall biosynthesis